MANIRIHSNGSNQSNQIIMNIEKFILEANQVRHDFVKVVHNYEIENHLALRTEVGSLLIMYDQMCSILEATTTIIHVDDNFVGQIPVTECCKIGPIINDNFCPGCGKRIVE